MRVRGCAFSGFAGLSGGAFGLELLQFLTGEDAIALDVTLAALEAEESRGATIPGAAEFAAGHGCGVTFQAVFPVLGIDALHAAELPIIADEDVDVELFLGGGWLAFLVIGVGEALQVGGIFTADDVGSSVDAGFQGIHTGGGLALNGAGAGGFAGIAAIGLDLKKRRHRKVLVGETGL
ncbi:MAG: hypothetical protein ABSB88_12350 [Bryobacteraceae bacterium]